MPWRRASRAPRRSRGRGRPAKLFALTEAGRDGFDQQYDDLAVQALRFLAETGGDEAVRKFAERRVSFVEDRFGEVTSANPELSPAEVLAKIFTDEGYAAGVRDLPMGEQLCQQHCPVSHVAHEFPQLCEAETEAISRVLGTPRPAAGHHRPRRRCVHDLHSRRTPVQSNPADASHPR